MAALLQDMNCIRSIANISPHDLADTASSEPAHDLRQRTVPSVIQSRPIERGILHTVNTASKGLRYSGTELLLARHCSNPRPAKQPTVSGPDGDSGNWDIIAILSF